MPDGNPRRRGDDELPPDPWAGLADPVPPPPPGPGQRGWGDPNWQPPQHGHPSRGAGGSGRPSPTDGSIEAPRHVPPPRRTVWHHPAVWIALLVLAGVLLLGALLEPRTPAPSEPSPDAVTAAGPAGPAAWAPTTG
ncbi:hypothetical protein [Nitriliruptor alkaliphilus]|uniref:hypothetical protein n=1 Tax=Nitriliruptor alkaliphilus TaxID=427918 RepID=UPI0006991EEB|nr:hypothetical protein [Nitriliruptor alkaliphilus]